MTSDLRCNVDYANHSVQKLTNQLSLVLYRRLCRKLCRHVGGFSLSLSLIFVLFFLFFSYTMLGLQVYFTYPCRVCNHECEQRRTPAAMMEPTVC